jgi:5,10-methylenetetrahydromethanopterin reductase
MAIATLDEISGGRALLGIGAGVSGFRELGVDARRSAVAIREAVDVVRRLLAGLTVTVKGEQVALDHGRLDFAAPRSDVPVYVASQRAAGCRVAGQCADGAIMQGCVAPPLVEFFRERVAEGARRAGRDLARLDLVARLNVCIDDDRQAARDVMRATVVRSLSAQRPDFFTFATARTALPPALRDGVLALPYTHDPAPLRALAPHVTDELVDAVTLTGAPAEVAADVVRLARAGISQVMVYPLARDGRVETTIDRFAREVMPLVSQALGGAKHPLPSGERAG